MTQPNEFGTSPIEPMIKLQLELQQTREELIDLQLRNADLAGVNVDLKQRLEQVKAERNMLLTNGNMAFQIANEKIERLESQLSAKDKVLEWYAQESVWDRDKKGWLLSVLDRGHRARSILSQYRTDTNGN